MPLKDNIYDKAAEYSGIDAREVYHPGKLTVVLDQSMTISTTPIYIISWKIDDAAWIISTKGRDRISDDDDAWTPGMLGFHKDTTWHRGVVFTGSQFKARRLVERIRLLTENFGLDIDYDDQQVWT